MYQSYPPRSPAESLPTMYDLPSEDPEEPGLPDEFHDFQPKLLRETCQPPTFPATEIFIGADLNLYYDGRFPQWYKRPDWFLVLGITPANRQEELRWSYVTWQESVNPFLIVELLSPGTETEDLGQKVRELSKPPLKWDVYERILRVPFYVVFDRYEHQLRVFTLAGGQYRPVKLLEPRFWFEELQLGLGVWQGAYQGISGQWLRWYDQAGNWILTEVQARQVAEAQTAAETQARQAAEAQVAAETQARQVAEAQTAAETQARQAAEAQVAAETQARQVAEAQTAAETQARQVAEAQVAAETQARRLAIPRLAALGLTPSQIAEALSLPLVTIEQYLSDQS